MKPALVVLAAGASTRLGRNKALVEFDGHSVIEHHLRAGSSLDEVQPVVITGKFDEEIRVHVAERARCVHNAAWEAGRTGGVRLAHRELSERDLLLAPVDVPLVPESVFRDLVREWLDAGSPSLGWLAPRHVGAAEGSGRFGHPLIVGRDLLERISEADADRPLRFLRDSAEPLLSLDCDSPAILNDLDTPEDLARLRARFA